MWTMLYPMVWWCKIRLGTIGNLREATDTDSDSEQDEEIGGPTSIRRSKRWGCVEPSSCRFVDGWLPIQPKDGIVDASEEIFEVSLGQLEV